MTAGRTNAAALSHHWCTPPKYVNAIRQFFDGKIGLDPCSNGHSIVRATVEYELPKHDGLTESWDFPTIYVNPPYGADRSRGTRIRDWLRKCAFAHKQHGAEVLALVPVATNTLHWKQCVWGAATAVAFLYDTRLRFLVDGVDGGKGAPMSCAMVYWGRHPKRFEDAFISFGAVVGLQHLHGKRVGHKEHQGNGVRRRYAVPSTGPRLDV
ncbi:MAG: DNA N-6-adenine-methyltransferase [Fimbriimonadaceae bacterium]